MALASGAMVAATWLASYEAAGRTRASLLAALGEGRHERDGEGDGLAAARLAATEEVFTGERVVEGDRLDGER